MLKSITKGQFKKLIGYEPRTIKSSQSKPLLTSCQSAIIGTCIFYVSPISSYFHQDVANFFDLFVLLYDIKKASLGAFGTNDIQHLALKIYIAEMSHRTDADLSFCYTSEEFKPQNKNQRSN